MVQWLRIHLAMQGTSVLPLVQEDPSSHGETKPASSNYEPMRCNYWSLHAQEPVLHKTSHHSEKPAQRNRVATRLCNQRKPTCSNQTEGSQEKKSYHADGTYYWYDAMKTTLSLCVFLPKTHNPSLIMTKKHQIPIEEYATKYLTSTHQNCLDHQKQWKSEKQ